MTGSVIVSVRRHELDELKPLWKALYDHQSEVAPHLRDREFPFDQAWTTRREIEKQQGPRLEPTAREAAST